MSWRQTFAKMIGVPEHQAEDALHSERAARAVMTRRNLFAGGAALAAGSVFSFPAPTPAPVALPLFVSPFFVSPFFAGPMLAMVAYWAQAQKGSSRS